MQRAEGTERHRLFGVGRAPLHADERPAAVAADGVARHDERVRDPRERDVERGGEVGHQVRVGAVDVDQHDEDPHFRRQRRHHAQRRDLGDAAVEHEIGIRVEPDLDGLPDLQLVDVGLAHPRPHPHRRRVDDVDDRYAGADFLAFLHFGHGVGLPDRADDCHAVDRRHDRHALGVGLRLAHRALGPAAADLEDLQIGLGRLALEGVGRLVLVERRHGLLDREVVLLDRDLRQQLVLRLFEPGPRQRRLGQHDLAVVPRPGGVLGRCLLQDLLIEVVQLGASIEGGSDLGLPVELDEQVALADGGARLDQPGDHQRLSVGTGEPRRRDRRGLHRFDRAAQADAVDELAALDFRRGGAPRRLPGFGTPGIPHQCHDGHAGSDTEEDRTCDDGETIAG